jgi:hypothetical protein
MKKKIVTLSLITFLAIGLWASVALSHEYISTIVVPISFTDLPKKYSMGYTSTSEIYLQLKGKGWDLVKFMIGNLEEFHVSVRRRAGRFKVDLINSVQTNSWLTSNYQVLEIVPNQIEYEVEYINTKRVKIVSGIEIEFKPDYAATSSVSIEPKIIEIYGPQSLLKKVDSIKTEGKIFKDISENFFSQLSLQEIPGISYSAKNCTMQFEVQKIVDKSFDEIPVETRNVPRLKELVLFPGKINIVLRGGINILGKLSKDSIKAYINYWFALKGSGSKINPIIQIPNFTSLISIEPKQQEFIIKQY